MRLACFNDSIHHIYVVCLHAVVYIYIYIEIYILTFLALILQLKAKLYS